MDATHRVSKIPNMPAPLRSAAQATSFPGGHSGREPPDPIPNSEVKTLCADGSLAVGQVRVGHRQDSKANPPTETSGGFFMSRCIISGPGNYPAAPHSNP